MVSKLFRFLASAGLLGLVKGAQVVQDWTLSSQPIAPDGFTRSAALVNGQYPGPLLALNKFDSATINVNNQLSDPTMRRSTSIHWHGIFQHQNAQYVLSSTYFTHSQACLEMMVLPSLLNVPLLRNDPEDPHLDLYDVDDETTVISLSDWYHTTAFNLENAWFAGGPEPVPDSGLINGAGRFTGGPDVTLTRVNVTQGKRYRLRLVSLSAEGFFNVSIQNHRMTVIEADGISTEPYVVDFLSILPAQRYINGTNTFAVLHYGGAPDAEPTSSQVFASGPVIFEEFKMAPLLNPGAPGGDGPADQVFNFTFTTTAANGDVWTINGVQYQSPTVPTLLNILSNPDPTFGAHENTFTLMPNATIEVAFIGGPGHAFHLHGHTFDVIQSASGGPLNFVNPPRRDTTASGGTTANPMRIRFRTDNPGPWFIHCHLDWHLEAGLAAVFAEDPAGIVSGPNSISPNQAWEQLCTVYNNLPDDEK
ncbi:hypothetical protein Clacol_004027 [Clathrus columnatus]|uniref:Laccase n=1 Tax=Clathrus columnatus TaxID=1419009 RepID=A0AAV5A9F7_9AGAM|nr:hypothetical protein Clacol_004027 [Clathrus columnatus]